MARWRRGGGVTLEVGNAARQSGSGVSPLSSNQKSRDGSFTFTKYSASAAATYFAEAKFCPARCQSITFQIALR